ncbi:hypothetical protein HJC99_00705 [Candidatus Saccharibacteria bacterium]|nr:hypothetical protein [Candidatus Saccharibacteria bacterium]
MPVVVVMMTAQDFTPTSAWKKDANGSQTTRQQATKDLSAWLQGSFADLMREIDGRLPGELAMSYAFEEIAIRHMPMGVASSNTEDIELDFFPPKRNGLAEAHAVLREELALAQLSDLIRRFYNKRPDEEADDRPSIATSVNCDGRSCGRVIGNDGSFGDSWALSDTFEALPYVDRVGSFGLMLLLS